MNLSDFTLRTQEGTTVPLSTYAGKVLLIVNTATRCGFTPQYTDLQALYEKHHDDGFEILDFPCNQFAERAPESDEEIHSFCCEQYGITFPQFAKVDVIGDNADPLFTYLAEHTSFEGFGSGEMASMLKTAVEQMDPDYKNNSNVKWNFTKFLIDREGNIVARFETATPIDEVAARVESVL